MAFEPSIWQEIPVPAELQSCSACELSRQRKRIVWGEGSTDARFIVLLDNPGLRENAAGEAFVCGTRQTLQQAVHESGLDQSEVFVTYVVKCRPTRAYDKPLCRGTCMKHFDLQMEGLSPLIVLCLGNVAAQSYWDSEEAEVKALRGTIHHVKGHLAATTWHPLAVRRRPTLAAQYFQDWKLAASAYKDAGNK